MVYYYHNFIFYHFQIILTAIVGVCAAGRLEHLERGYLPPDHGSSQQSFGSNSNSVGSFGSRGSPSFRSLGSSGFGGSGAGSFHSGPSISAAQSTQYLPPDHGPSGGSFGSSFAHSGAHGKSQFYMFYTNLSLTYF